MAIPDYQSIMLPLLELAADDQIHRVHDGIDLLAQQFKLTAEERREVIPSGRVSRFHNNVTWARTYLKKAGLLEDPKRGEFRITDRGRQVLAGGHGSIGVRFLEQFDEFRKFKTARRVPRPDVAAKLDLPEETPEEALQAAYQTLRNSVASDLLDQVRRLSPAFFERLVVDVLVAMGYGGSRGEAGEAIGHAGDEGIDGIIKEDCGASRAHSTRGVLNQPNLPVDAPDSHRGHERSGRLKSAAASGLSCGLRAGAGGGGDLATGTDRHVLRGPQRHREGSIRPATPGASRRARRT